MKDFCHHVVVSAGLSIALLIPVILPQCLAASPRAAETFTTPPSPLAHGEQFSITIPQGWTLSKQNISGRNWEKLGADCTIVPVMQPKNTKSSTGAQARPVKPSHPFVISVFTTLTSRAERHGSFDGGHWIDLNNGLRGHVHDESMGEENEWEFENGVVRWLHVRVPSQNDRTVEIAIRFEKSDHALADVVARQLFSSLRIRPGKTR